MEPRLPAPHMESERPLGAAQQNPESAPASSEPERRIEYGHEQVEQRGETAQPANTSPILPAPVIAAPEPAVSVPSDSTASTADDGMPLVASDEDLIEKEWVDKAKSIIVETKDDPYRREQEVGKLQVDYLRKRYGKELGAPQQADM